ncbi:MAG TPA: response regulator [Candidatus Limnocylindria bacterium]
MPDRAKVLCVDADRDIAEILLAVLTDEGYDVSLLYDVAADAVLRAVGRVEPDAVLLDTSGSVNYGEGWQIAASIHARPRPVPVVMFTAHAREVAEARAGTSPRSRDAAFVAVLPKPFELDELLVTVAAAARGSTPFEHSQRAENRRTRELVAALAARGATNIKPSALREWALFSDDGGHLVQLYWWQLRGVYQVGRYDEEGLLVMLGQVLDRDLAIDLVLPRPN